MKYEPLSSERYPSEFVRTCAGDAINDRPHNCATESTRSIRILLFAGVVYDNVVSALAGLGLDISQYKIICALCETAAAGVPLPVSVNCNTGDSTGSIR